MLMCTDVQMYRFSVWMCGSCKMSCWWSPAASLRWLFWYACYFSKRCKLSTWTGILKAQQKSSNFMLFGSFRSCFFHFPIFCPMRTLFRPWGKHASDTQWASYCALARDPKGVDQPVFAILYSFWWDGMFNLDRFCTKGTLAFATCCFKYCIVQILSDQQSKNFPIRQSRSTQDASCFREVSWHPYHPYRWPRRMYGFRKKSKKDHSIMAAAWAQLGLVV